MLFLVSLHASLHPLAHTKQVALVTVAQRLNKAHCPKYILIFLNLLNFTKQATLYYWIFYVKCLYRPSFVSSRSIVCAIGWSVDDFFWSGQNRSTNQRSGMILELKNQRTGARALKFSFSKIPGGLKINIFMWKVA